MTARVQVAARVCECCGEKFERRTFPSGQLERLRQFAKRRFCSRECYRSASAEGNRLRPVGERIDQPYGLFASVGAFDLPQGRLATGPGYPWDRKQAPRPAPNPGPFSAERQMRPVEDRREDRL